MNEGNDVIAYVEKQRRAYIRTGLGFGMDFSNMEENTSSDQDDLDLEDITTSDDELINYVDMVEKSNSEKSVVHRFSWGS